MESSSRSRLITLGVIAALAVIALVGSLQGGRPPARQPAPQTPAVQPGGEPQITLYVNQAGEKKKIKLEDYVAGVVAAELDPQWPEQALAAQAILARTFTLQKINYEHGVPQHGADASTDPQEFQAYDPSKINDNVRKAVASTRGQVIEYNGKYVRAWFHSNAGGKTDTAQAGLDFNQEPTPYIRVVSDPGQQVAPPGEKNWQITVPLTRVREAVRSIVGKDPGVIANASVAKKSASGRAVTVKLNNITLSGPALRLALGAELMKSTLLDQFQIRGQQLYITGRGRGHGVGMSQWGAYYYARQGKAPQEIIRQYYQGVTFTKAYS
ncbi:MAG: SpoIID/LytB domain-containing protein [Thermacetogeniaceae bacterium]